MKGGRMPFCKVTYDPENERAHIYSNTCNFNCRACTYKAKEIEENVLKVDEIGRALEGLKLKVVSFLGREPTTNPKLQEMVDLVKSRFNIQTRILTNGSNPIPKGIDAASISIKAYSDEIHRDYTGVSNINVLRNFVEAYKSGIEVRASSVFIPGYIDLEEIEKVSKFIADIDPAIPYHIIGFIPFVEVPWRAPTLQEIEEAVRIAQKYLERVTFSLPNLSLKDYPSTLPDSELEYKLKSIRVL